MSDPKPTSWEIASALISAVRDLQRRAESDSLRVAVLVVAFLVVRQSVTTQISVLGLTIDDRRIVQFAIVPLAAFYAVRYVKAQKLTLKLSRALEECMSANLADVPAEVCPPDWDMARDLARRTGRPVERAYALTFGVMVAAVIAGTVMCVLDASGNNAWAACLSVACTLAILLTTAAAHSAWTFIGVRAE